MMMWVVVVGLAMGLALLGHTSFWVGLVNRMHGLAWPEGVLRGLTLACALLWAILGGSLLWEVALSSQANEPKTWTGWCSQLAWPWQGYLVCCWLIAGRNLWAWLWGYLLHRPPHVLLSQQVESILLPMPAQKHPEHHPLVWLPQNEILRVELTRREIRLPLLPPQLDGLTLLHLSDLHFTGRVAQEWFRQTIEFCAQLQADLVTLTGDFLDSLDCLDWIPKVLAPLRGRWGVYFILGNHDWRLDWRRIREEITQLGFVWLGGRWTLLSGVRGVSEDRSTRVASNPPLLVGLSIPPNFDSLPAGQVGGEKNREFQLLLAGNELPWIGPPPDFRHAPPPAGEGGPVRILLAHSPDQLRWARQHQFDLMLAGHTHGGQVRIPLVGPILTPSRTGVRYSGGVFYRPPTVLHVSRGISAEWPVRWNCPPEVVLVVLRSPSGAVPNSP